MNARSRAVIEALIPQGGQPPLPGAFESGFDDFYARFQNTALPSMRLGFRAALWAAAWLSPLLIGRVPPLSRLSSEDRERALEAMGASRSYHVRQLLLLLKAVISFHYGAHPAVRRALEFPS
ncbi:MAG: hypothetical protein HY077_15320 [Elusimicrobia bacterium]|nr:hypothetical protein [Elusimicrobiota bacterium]